MHTVRLELLGSCRHKLRVTRPSPGIYSILICIGWHSACFADFWYFVSAGGHRVEISKQHTHTLTIFINESQADTGDTRIAFLLAELHVLLRMNLVHAQASHLILAV